MLREALDWLTTPADRLTRKSGQLSEFIAISSRRRRNRAAWAEHERRTKETVVYAANQANPDGTAILLGAGHLHDIPLEDLSAQFGHVVLVDLAFSWPTRRLAKALKNVSCVRHDVTEAFETLADGAGDTTKVPRPRALIDDDRITFVASVNLLSQLPVQPGRLLERQGLSADLVETAQRAIIENHLAWLSRFRCPLVLICDRSYEVLDANKQVIEVIDPLHGVILPEATDGWVWDIAPFGEVHRDYAVRNRVVVIENPTRP
jgi:hypothetical protein